MKVKFSWYESENSHHTSEWDVPYCDTWKLRSYIDEQLELLKLQREKYYREKAEKEKAESDALAAPPAEIGKEKPAQKEDK